MSEVKNIPFDAVACIPSRINLYYAVRKNKNDVNMIEVSRMIHDRICDYFNDKSKNLHYMRDRCYYFSVIVPYIAPDKIDSELLKKYFDSF